MQGGRWNCYGDLKKEVRHLLAGLGELGHSTVKAEALATIRICRMTRLSYKTKNNGGAMEVRSVHREEMHSNRAAEKCETKGL